ncbi:serine/threonine-protein kinase [Streptomyces sp. NPDC016562]|uniref:serine/threonine-protein kinase n=1 Tax=Streptomyces sp. NPDC016562 TaxID=3364966 RepID=UPI0036F5DC28
MNSATEVFQPLLAEDPPTVAGYRLAARLGAGGMGRVYLSHTRGGRPVAIKVVRPELAEDPAFRRRFRREVEAARRVKGAYTAELIDAEADGTPPWLATLYVPGPSLSEAVARRGPLPVPAVLWLMAGVAEALQAIHGAGIVHRDLKPSNVLLAADGPRVIDFGISLASGVTAATGTGNAIGTPQYMAPEQASSGEVTAATDVFTLGQTAAFAATGEALYGGGPQLSVMFRIVHSQPDLSHLPEQLRPVIARCLAADPKERATPAEIVAWCRQRLGADADAGGGPAVWRELMGPEVEVPAPVPDPTSVHTTPLLRRWRPAPAPAAPEQRRARRRRVALVTAAAVTTSAMVLTGLAWTYMDDIGRLLRVRNGSPAAQKTPSGPVSGPAAGTASGSAASATGGGTAGAAGPASGPPQESKPPAAVPYAGVRLDTENSVGVKKEPAQRQDRSGDIRLNCERTGCDLESDSSVITMLFPDQQGSLDVCRAALTDVDTREFGLAGATNGSAFCIKHPSGDIALFVIQNKSLVQLKNWPQWVTADMTVWRAS